MVKRVVVVGAGLVGLATAKAIAEDLGLSVTVIDKEHSVAVHQSGRNSGVVHAGLYYQPGSLKAALCRRGAAALRTYCDAHGLPFRATGKLIVASSPEELPGLREIERRAAANGVLDVRWLESRELSKIEPYVRGIAALYSPASAVVDYRAVARQMADDVRARDGEIRLGEPVIDIQQTAGEVVVRTSVGEHRADHLVVCAGLQSDRLAAMAGAPRTPAIAPFRGEYYELVPESEHLVRSMIYPVPDPRYPFLGVHFTRGVDGTVHVGPNAVPALALEGYRWRDVDLRELAATVRWPGSRALARQHWRMGINEMTASLSKRLYYKKARRYIPDLRMTDLRRSPSGVRAQALRADGTLEDDFALDMMPLVTLVRNAPSPAATSSLPIGEHLSGLVAERLGV
jgi:L-2-hydroxyglutarate oxidase LhgO